jgi:uncharacterized protein (TIGR00255 family)
VNHRYLDINLRLGEEIRFIEPMIRQMIADSLNRGRVDLTVKYSSTGLSGSRINQQVTSQLLGYQKLLHGIDARIRDLSTAEILQWPGVLEMADQDEDSLTLIFQELMACALSDIDEQRQQEGEKIKELLLGRVDQIKKLVAEVREILPQVTRQFRENFQEKLAQMEVDIDSHRLEQELVIFLGKQDIAEELDRLDVHLGQVATILGSRKTAGRRLDFLMQELNREANTLTSKSIDVRLNSASVQMKVLIEQMREQVQNIE